MSPPKPKPAVDLVEAINAIIAKAIRKSGGIDDGNYYQEVSEIIEKFEDYPRRN